MLLEGNPNTALFATFDHLDERKTADTLAGRFQPMRRFVAAHRVCNNERKYRDYIFHETYQKALKAFAAQIPGWYRMLKQSGTLA